MELLYDIATVIQTIAISLGVGTSTVAITSFFVAIADGHLDATERRMMQPVYIILRVAMGLILLTTIMEGIALVTTFGTDVFGGAAFSAWTIIAVLFLNAYMMTKHLIPSTFGPAIQAGSWYTLGFMTAMFAIGAQNFSYLSFLIGYGLFLVAAIAFVNGMMVYLKMRRPADTPLAE